MTDDMTQEFIDAINRNAGRHRMMKVFDCQDMPDDIKEHFWDVYRGVMMGNDCYVDWTINAAKDLSEGELAVDGWLIANGAEGPRNEDREGEHVLVRHWW